MNKKISELLETIDLNDEDILMILQSGQNKKIKAINALKNINKSLSDLNTTKAEKTEVNILKDKINSLEKSGIYSTTEEKIGTWHDGNNIYRKVLLIDVSKFSAEAENTLRYSDYGIDGNIIVTKYSGLVERRDGIWQVLPCTLSDWHIDIYDFSLTQFRVKISQRQSSVGVQILTLILEYVRV